MSPTVKFIRGTVGHRLWVVRIHFQIRKQKGLATRLATRAAGLQSHEDGVNLVQHLGVVELQDPALLAQGTLANGLNMAGCGGWI